MFGPAPVAQTAGDEQSPELLGMKTFELLIKRLTRWQDAAPYNTGVHS